MTPEQEAALIKSNETLTTEMSKLAPLLAQIPTLTEQVKVLANENTELKKNVTLSSQEIALRDLKTKYPDVPESIIKALPETVRETEAKALQEKFSTVKTALVKTDPHTMWANAGGIGPTSDAEKAAQAQELKAKHTESAKSGDVVGMLASRSGELLEHLRRSFAKV